jgi:GntR family transcriptional regulator, transcriptional repressor for pyruvate dehydrogenase complex
MPPQRPAAAAAPRAAKAGLQVRPPTRKRASERVFEALAREILAGESQPGTALPTQRELAERFGISMLVVRQAIHSLEDLKLVRVRQGGATIVLDPNEATDLRLVDLRVQLSPSGQRFGLDTTEMRMLFLMQLLILAERRITPKHIGVLHYLLDSLPKEPSLEETRHFRLEYWQQVADATQNPVIQQQMRWWRARAREAVHDGHGFGFFPQQPVNLPFHRALTDALEQHTGAVALYMSRITPMLDWLDAKRSGPAKP